MKDEMFTKLYRERQKSEKYRNEIKNDIDKNIDLIMEKVIDENNDTDFIAAKKWQLAMKEIHAHIISYLKENKDDIVEEVLAQID